MKNYRFLLFLLLFCIPFIGIGQNSSKKTDELSIQIEKKDATEGNSGDGYIKLTVSGGGAPYRIVTIGPNGVSPEKIGAELNLTNIKSGDYYFIIFDASGNSIKRKVSILNQR